MLCKFPLKRNPQYLIVQTYYGRDKLGLGLEDGLGASGLLGSGRSYDLKCRDQNVGYSRDFALTLPDVFGQFPQIFETKVGINRGKIPFLPYFRLKSWLKSGYPDSPRL